MMIARSRRTLSLLVMTFSIVGCFGGRIGNVGYYVSPDEFQHTMTAYNGGDPNARDSAGRTPLMLALVTCFHDVSKKIIDAGADVNAVDDAGNSTLDYLFIGRSQTEKCPDDVRMFELLRQKGVRVPGDVLLAAFRARSPIFDVLLESGDVNANDGSFGGLLHRPPVLADAALMQRLLDKGADPMMKNGAGQTPLHVAAGVGAAKAVEMLIARKVDINAVDGKGDTPLHAAAQAPSAATTKLLLAAGANVNAPSTNESATPLDYAIAWGGDETIAALKEKGGTATGYGDRIKAANVLRTKRAADKAAFGAALNEIAELDKDARLMWWVLKRDPKAKACRVDTFEFDIKSESNFKHVHTWPKPELDAADGALAPIARGERTCHRSCGDRELVQIMAAHQQCATWTQKKIEPEKPLSSLP